MIPFTFIKEIYNYRGNSRILSKSVIWGREQEAKKSDRSWFFFNLVKNIRISPNKLKELGIPINHDGKKRSAFELLSFNNISFDDVFKITNGQHPRIFKLYLSKKICVETFVVFEKILGFMRTMDKSIKEHFIWPEHSKKIRKYMPFVKFNETQCKLIMKEVFLNASKSN